MCVVLCDWSEGLSLHLFQGPILPRKDLWQPVFLVVPVSVHLWRRQLLLLPQLQLISTPLKINYKREFVVMLWNKIAASASSHIFMFISSRQHHSALTGVSFVVSSCSLLSDISCSFFSRASCGGWPMSAVTLCHLCIMTLWWIQLKLKSCSWVWTSDLDFGLSGCLIELLVNYYCADVTTGEQISELVYWITWLNPDQTCVCVGVCVCAVLPLTSPWVCWVRKEEAPRYHRSFPLTLPAILPSVCLHSWKWNAWIWRTLSVIQRLHHELHLTRNCRNHEINTALALLQR